MQGQPADPDYSSRDSISCHNHAKRGARVSRVPSAPAFPTSAPAQPWHAMNNPGWRQLQTCYNRQGGAGVQCARQRDASRKSKWPEGRESDRELLLAGGRLYHSPVQGGPSQFSRGENGSPFEDQVKKEAKS